MPQFDQIGSGGLALLEKWEGVKSVAYLDEAGLLTGGMGHRITDGSYSLGEEIPNPLICLWATTDTHSSAAAVNSEIGDHQITQNQFDALCCFEFNIGRSGFDSSSVLRDVLSNDLADVPRAMKLWDKVHVNGLLVVSRGLITRRQAEVDLWNTPDAA